jgi:steroid delta-isomerase-like uncharacterized protein
MVAAGARRTVERMLDEVVNGRRPDVAERLIGNAGIRRRIAAFSEAFPDLSVVPTLIVADGAYVAVHLTGRATHRGIFQGIPATGRSWAASCTALYRVEAGKVVDMYENWDLLSILEQLGGVMRSPSASA